MSVAKKANWYCVIFESMGPEYRSYGGQHCFASKKRAETFAEDVGIVGGFKVKEIRKLKGER